MQRPVASLLARGLHGMTPVDISLSDRLAPSGALASGGRAAGETTAALPAFILVECLAAT